MSERDDGGEYLGCGDDVDINRKWVCDGVRWVCIHAIDDSVAKTLRGG